MSPPPHADRTLPEDRSHSLCFSRSSQLRCCSPPPLPLSSCRHPAPSSLRPPPPAERRRRFRGGRGGVVIVVVIRVRAPHVVNETPGIVVVRMGEDNRPSPTTTRQVLPLWRHRRDAVRRSRRRERRRGGAAAGSEIFEDVEGDYYGPKQDGEDRIAPGSAVLRPHQTWGWA